MSTHIPEGWPEKLAEHFRTQDFIHSNLAEKHELDNTPPEGLLGNALRAAALAEQARGILAAHFGREIPLQETSGYRSEEVNRRAGGHAISAHREARALDLQPVGIAAKEAFNVLLRAFDYDKLVLETDGDSTWLHLQAPPDGMAPRKLAFVGVKGGAFRKV